MKWRYPRPRRGFNEEPFGNSAAGFEYGARLTEFMLLGNLAQRAGQNKIVLWDGPNMKVTNLPELNAWVKTEYRQGWQAE